MYVAGGGADSVFGLVFFVKMDVLGVVGSPLLRVAGWTDFELLALLDGVL